MKFVKEITSDRYEEIDINECRCPSCNKKSWSKKVMKKQQLIDFSRNLFI